MSSPLARSLTCAALLLAAGASGVARAADVDAMVVHADGLERAAPAEGLPCDSPELAAAPSIWQGHFAGGWSHYLGPGRTVALDWRDEKLCFSSHASCNRYVFGMRRQFHRPEGYFTCLLIR